MANTVTENTVNYSGCCCCMNLMEKEGMSICPDMFMIGTNIAFQINQNFCRKNVCWWGSSKYIVVAFDLCEMHSLLAYTGWHKKTGTFEKPNKNWRNPRKKIYWQKLNLCRMRQSRILQSMQQTQGDTKERELLKCVVAVKECLCGGGRHLQDVIFKHW